MKQSGLMIGWEIITTWIDLEFVAGFQPAFAVLIRFLAERSLSKWTLVIRESHGNRWKLRSVASLITCDTEIKR